MEFISAPYVYCFPFCIAVLSWWWVVSTITRRRRLPPGPPGWPIVKNIFDLVGMAPHQTLASLSQKYGPVVWLELGAMKTIAVQSSEAAKELFKMHDLSFADRKINDAIKCGEIHKSIMATGTYGPHWKMLRRLYNSELFTNKRMNETASLRRKCADNMINLIREEAQKCGSVDVAEVVFLMAFHLQCQLIFSCDINELPHDGDKMEFFKLTSTMTELSGVPNLSDFFPYLRRFDLQGIRRKLTRTIVKALGIISAAVEQRIEDKKNVDWENRRKDFLDVLLDYEGKNGIEVHENLSRKDISAVIVELFTAGSETINATTEWAMSELLRNPASMKKAQAELDKVIGRSREVEESDIENLPYLRAVVKETLRLHPPLPFLIPRTAVQDVENFMGYSIPKDTQVFVNVWAIGRDPNIWDDPLTFKPERFLEGDNIDMDFRGQHFQFMPFGAGRRICAGLVLGDRILHLVLGSLLRSFDWVLEDGVTPETLDMGERFGTVLRKNVSLKAVPKPLMVL